MQAMPKDIEDIVQLGKEVHVCPYYATRNSIKQAEVRQTEGLSYWY